MTADRLLANYDRIADAPDAEPRLRRYVLDLAVRGKLVEQDPNDEPASELLKRENRRFSSRTIQTSRILVLGERGRDSRSAAWQDARQSQEQRNPTQIPS